MVKRLRIKAVTGVLFGIGIWCLYTIYLSDDTAFQENIKVSENLEGTSSPVLLLSDDAILTRQNSQQQRRSQASTGRNRSDQKMQKILNNSFFSEAKRSLLESGKEDPTLDPLIRKDLEALALINASGADPLLRFDSSNNILSITGEFSLPSYDGTDASKITAVKNLVSRHKSLTGLGGNEVAIVTSDIVKNGRGESIIRLDRKYQELPVWGRQMVVTEKNGSILSISGKFREVPNTIDISSRLNDATLKKLVANEFEAQGLSIPAIETAVRGIYIRGNISIYAYRVIAESSYGRKWELYFSPATKFLIAKSPLFYEVSTPSSGIDLMGEERSFNSNFQNNEYFLKDESFPQESYSVVAEWSDEGSYPYVKSSSSDTGWSAAGVSAIFNSAKTYDYFFNTHGRSSFDGNGTKLVSIVNATDDGLPYFNAYWNGSQMIYGTGADGSKNLAIALDVAGHEFSHGVVQSTANLRYQNQSGALNESFADFFGAMIDRDDWYIGEDLAVPYGQYNYLRDMSNPSSTGNPGHMDNFVNLPNTKEGDWGGVHVNSGIQNRALYLLAEGLALEGKGASIGKDKTERLAYATLQKLPDDAEFVDSANTMILEAESMYGSSSVEYQSVINAWDSVGVRTSAVVTQGGVEDISLKTGDDILVHLYPKDGSINELFYEEYDIYVQLVNQPFSEYVSSAEIGPINEFPAAATQPTLFTDVQGNLYSVYVGTDGKAWITNLSDTAGDYELLESDGVHSIAASPNGDGFAVVFGGDPTIYVYSFAQNIWEVVPIVGPSYSEDGRGAEVDIVDAISFDSTGQKIIFDFALCVPVLEQPECQGLWSIGIYDLGTKNLEYPFSSANVNIDLGFPRFSNTRNDVIAFDYQDWADFDESGKAFSRSLIYDLGEREIIGAYETDFSEEKISSFGIPSFVAEDVALVLQGQGDQYISLFQISLDESFNAIADSFSWLFPFDSAFGKAHRNVYNDIMASLRIDMSNVDLGTNLVGATRTAEFTLFNDGNREIALTEIALTNSVMSTNLTNRVLSPEESVTFDVYFEPNAASLGLFSGTVSIRHSGDNATLNLGISAYVDSDTDNDGISNSDDPDDDGDGISDDVDRFPLDPLESSDLDDDGVGDNSDIDADNDGVANLLELSLFDNGVIDYNWGNGWLGYEQYNSEEDGSYCKGPEAWGYGECVDLSWQTVEDDVNGTVLEVQQLPYEGQGGASIFITEKNGDSSSADLTRFSQGFIKFDIKVIEGPAEHVFFAGLYGRPVGDGRSTGWIEFQSAERGSWITMALPLVDLMSPDAEYPYSGDLEEIYWPFMFNHWGGLNETLRYRLDNISWVSHYRGVDSAGQLQDVFPLDAAASMDFDGDNMPDSWNQGYDAFTSSTGLILDNDDDNDLVADADDAFPLDATESVDTDGDEIGNNADTDDDGDLVLDVNDVFPLDNSESVDTDSDGIGNNADTDDDGDGVLDAEDAFPLDSAESSDSDGDGLGDNGDTFPNDASETVDSDSDGIGDNSDVFPNNALYSLDNDSDGMPDAWEIRYGLDPIDASDASSDQDNDGVTAYDEFIAGTIPAGSLDIDGNSIPYERITRQEKHSPKQQQTVCQRVILPVTINI